MRAQKKAKPGRPQRAGRRRAVPWWRTRRALVGLAVVVAVAVAGGGWAAWRAGVPQRAADAAVAWALDTSADAGLAIREVYVVGRRQTPRAELMAAVGAERGDPILGLDLEAARERVMALPWVRDASVERLLPDTVVLRVDERRPLALWQRDGRFTLIGDDGVVVRRDDLEPFADLLVVVGDDAPAHAADLVDMLAAEPDLRRRVTAAVRVGGRRWNVRLAGGIDVRLPEEDAGAAWARLAEYQRNHGVLDRDVRVLDLRLPDRLIVRTGREGRPRTDGQDT